MQGKGKDDGVAFAESGSRYSLWNKRVEKSKISGGFLSST